MADYVIIEPDGALTEHDGHWIVSEVGCHGAAGQNLYQTRQYIDGTPFMLRVVGCDCALAMPEEHPENPIATAVLAVLGFSNMGYGVRGRIAIYRVDWQNERTELREVDLSKLRNQANAVRAAQKVPPPPAELPMLKVFQVDLGDDGQLSLGPLPLDEQGPL